MCVVTYVQCKENHKSMMNKSDEEKKKNINLLDCVKLFTVEEQLGEDDRRCVHSADYCIEVCVVMHGVSCSYACMCTHVHAHTCTHTHTHTRACMHARIHTPLIHVTLY